MVVFVDLESEDDDPLGHPMSHRFHGDHARRVSHVDDQDDSLPEISLRSSPRPEDLNGQLFASALACYPVSLSLAAHLDLNDLYQLSRTCRRVHDGLTQFAHQLRTQSLHCVNDVPDTTSEEEVDAFIFQDAIDSLNEADFPGIAPAFPVVFHPEPPAYHVGSNSVLGLRGKVSRCARDMVAPCRKCGIIVCRNCALKAPPAKNLPNRHRRLCRTCLDTPLMDHLRILSGDHDLHDTPPASSASSARSVRSLSSSSSNDSKADGGARSFTSATFLREPCTCATGGVYLCQPCGQSLGAADTTYKRVWTWRSRYSTHIGGGLGTGLGLGNQGQKCGRGEFCLERGVGGVCWVEIECSEARAQHNGREEAHSMSRSSTPIISDHENDATTPNRPGYFSQELEGIGGVLKKKVKKRIKVGATVYEYDDERESGKYLLRESIGKQRSWCGWCSRVCPSEKDQADLDRLLG